MGEADVVIGDLLGAGGMGRVFAAKDSARTPLAVKVLHDVLAEDPVMVARFLEEGRAAKRVSHRNVVRVVDHGLSASGSPFLIMQRAPGIPLGALIQRDGPLPLLRTRKIATQILAGLAAIHRAGLVHGDIKSDNVLVDPTQADTVTIIDFGLARPPGTLVIGGDEQMLTGTPEYMAPEVIRGEPMSASAELYAVGVIIYEMLTGSTPFGGGTATAVFERHLSDDLIAPSLRCPERNIPIALESVIARALDKDPAARHLNADLFASAIERAVSPDLVERPPKIGPRISPIADTIHDLPRRHCRFAEGTVPGDSSDVQRRRHELTAALTERAAEPIVVAYLMLVQALVHEHRLVAAAQELQAGIAWLDAQGLSPPSVWRLLLTLATIFDGLGDRVRARDTAVDALAAARHGSDRMGRARAEALLRRLRR